MFTGIIEKVGVIREISEPQAAVSSQARLLVVETGFQDLALGESVAVNGVCLTVLEPAAHETRESGIARFYVSSETLALTNLGALAVGSRVNLERALLLSSRLSGHLVQGHVDGLGEFLGARDIRAPEGTSYEVRVRLPAGLEKYCVRKGSIALNGISLTLNQLEGREASLMIIPHTWNHTQLSTLQSGATINVEVDVLAKYAEKLLCRN